MVDEHRGVALVILGVVSVIAVIGLVLMFSGSNRGAGAIFTSATGGGYVCPVSTGVGEPQWFPVLAGPGENAAFLEQWQRAGFECMPSPVESGFDEYGLGVEPGMNPRTWCCRNPVVGQAGIEPQVYSRGPVSLTTRRGRGQPVSPQEAVPAGLPRLGP